eukprot:TRINITY_DN1257_c0_g1_i1.p3 TRINITY_DN1257_c0_g1~~TRINITY_DN1257_c0_g1_i1.p3  ORF type:complete len:419 (+),score=120.20 TRINITY_DN1257_c0_g1_i1:1211-2467(+)
MLRLVARVARVSTKQDTSRILVRHLNLHEHHSKQLLGKYGVNVQRCDVASDAESAVKVAKQINAKEYVVKAAVLAGGRGKGVFDTGFKGGVHLTKKPEEVGKLAKEMIGHRLTTKQTPPDGVLVRQVMIADSVDIEKEAYFAIVMDRASQGPVLVASSEGGMDIEAVAEKTPHKVLKEKVDIAAGVKPEQTKRLASALGFKPELVDQAAEQMAKLYKLFFNSDATLVEINPFAQTKDNRIVCVDAKLNFDDNSSFRQEDIFKLHASEDDDPREVEAAKYNLNFVGMDGNIGCLVNGAGLAMATMDIIKLHGGLPANFLDVGGGAGEKQVVESFRILTSDKRVKAILVNIFGGIVRCDVIAQGIIAAAKVVNLQVPLVVRLEGTNVNEAKNMLSSSGLPIITADGLEEAAKKAVAALPN